MASRYYVGGSGNWSDSSHWSTTSGGVGGASVPTSVDDVFIDDNSGDSGFILSIQTIIIFKSITDSRNSSWTLDCNTQSVNAYGNFRIGAHCTFDGFFNSFNIFEDSNISIEIDSVLSNSIFPRKNLTITTNLSINTVFGLNNLGAGEVIAFINSSQVKCQRFFTTSLSVGDLNLGSSVVNLNFQNDADIQNVNLNAGTSTLRLLDSSQNFESGSLTWYNVDLQGDNITINGSPTMNQLKAKTGNTINIQASQTITLSDLDIDGCSLIGLT